MIEIYRICLYTKGVKTMWRELILSLYKDNNNVKLNNPATVEELLEIESKLKIKLPDDIKSLLLEFNGDNWFLLSTKQILEINIQLRNITGFMPLDCFIFVAGNGCGDYFGYPITVDGVKDGEIFLWDHELDNRVLKAIGLKDIIEKYYNDSL
jgi:hypothetical protein